MYLLVALFEDREAAGALKDRLTRAGIDCRVRSDALLQSLIFWAKPAAAERVTVADAQFDTARKLIEEWDKNEQVLKAAIRCIECGSPRVEYPQYTRKFVTPLIIELMISLGLGEKSYYCTDCQYTWRKNMRAQPEPNRFNTPKPGRDIPDRRAPD